MKTLFKVPTSLIITCITVSLLTISCKKYEDGPVVSLTSKKSRVANTWIVEKAIENNEDVTEDYDQYDLKLTRNGDAKLDADYEFGNLTYEYNTDGTWKFEDNKETLNLNFEDNDADRTFQILRLKQHEMWLRLEGEELELRLKTK